MQRACDLAQQAIAVDDSNVLGHMLLGGIYFDRRQYDLALIELERALALKPNDPSWCAARSRVVASQLFSREVYLTKPFGEALRIVAEGWSRAA